MSPPPEVAAHPKTNVPRTGATRAADQREANESSMTDLGRSAPQGSCRPRCSVVRGPSERASGLKHGQARTGEARSRWIGPSRRWARSCPIGSFDVRSEGAAGWEPDVVIVELCEFRIRGWSAVPRRHGAVNNG